MALHRLNDVCVSFHAAWYEIVLTDKSGPPGREASSLAYRLEVRPYSRICILCILDCSALSKPGGIDQQICT